MTPEEAIALKTGTTPGPWTMHRHAPEDFIRVTGDDLKDIADNGVVEGADARLIAAAPDLAQTIAEMQWEYRTEEWSGNYWYPCGEWDADASLYEGYISRDGERLVRRLVGPVEVVEG